VAKRKGSKTTATDYPGVYRMGDGRWLLRLYVHGKEKERVVQASTAQAAAKRRHELQAELTAASRERPLLFDVAKAWLKRKVEAKRPDGTTRLAPTSIDRYTVAVRKWIVPILGELHLDEINERVIRDRRDALAEQQATTTVNGHLRMLKTLLADHGVATRVAPLETDDTRITDDEPNLLTQVELQRFLKAARDLYPQHYPLVLFMVTTGCRISTARAVRWEDLDATAGVVHLRRRLSKSEVLPGVKRSRVKRDDPPLLPAVLAELDRHRAGFNERQRASGYVFASPRTGKPVVRSALDEPFVAMLARAEITKRFTPHGLRRTAALAYRRAGSSELAMDVLGHMTEEMHRHYAPEQGDERRAAAERAFAGAIK
jgi:integrase